MRKSRTTYTFKVIPSFIIPPLNSKLKLLYHNHYPQCTQLHQFSSVCRWAKLCPSPGFEGEWTSGRWTVHAASVYTSHSKRWSLPLAVSSSVCDSPDPHMHSATTNDNKNNKTVLVDRGQEGDFFLLRDCHILYLKWLKSYCAAAVHGERER